ncbi:myb-like protein V [Lucilia sericata]|uniref:myb-like protein V n=1 Tax=Lucilia sericata TaxID=13632 RepID=UPI0018A85F04|nr:myb-like protein V [Lucilia sericata]
MENKDESIKTNEDQNVEAFKFFGKTKNRKVSPKSNKYPKRPLFLFPVKRKSRLKSETVETAHNLPDGEFDISKEDLDRSEGDNITSPNESNFNEENMKNGELKSKKKVNQPMRRTTRLKTEIFVESFPHNSDDDGDTNKEEEPKITSANKRLFSDLDEKEEECKKKVKRPKTTLPKRRSTRLKSECSHNIQDEEFDRSKDDFHIAELWKEPANKENPLTSINTPKDNMFSDSNVEDNDINVTINNIVDSLTDSTPKKSKKRKRDRKSELDNSFEKLAENMLESIDTNVIVDMMQNKSLESQKTEDETEVTRSSKRIRKLTQSENCDENFENNEHQLDLAQNYMQNLNAKSTKKKGTKSLVEQYEEVNGRSKLVNNNDDQQQLDFTYEDRENTSKSNAKAKSPIKRSRKSLAEKCEEENDQNKLEDQIVNDDDQQQLDFTNKDRENISKSDAKAKSPKKRFRKYLAEKCEEVNDQSKLEDQIVNDDDQQQSDFTNKDRGNTAKSKSPIKRGRKSLAEKCEEVNDQSKLEDQIANDDDQLQLDFTNNDRGNTVKSEAKPKSSIKKRRKSLAERLEDSNVNDGDHQILNSANENTEKFAEKTKSPIKRATKSTTRKSSENNEEEIDQTKLPTDLNDRQQFALSNNGNVDSIESSAGQKPTNKTLTQKLNESIELNKLEDNNVNNRLSDNDEQQINLTYNEDDDEDENLNEANNLDTENILQDKLPPQPSMSNNDTVINSKKSKEIPKKRGRKTLAEKLQQSTADAKITEQIPKVPKKRGRKPKILNNTLKETDNNAGTNDITKYLTVNDKPPEEINKNTTSPDDERPKTRSKSKPVTNNTADTTVDTIADTTLNTTVSSTKKEKPKGRGKSKVLKVNVAKALTKNKVTKFSKLTKEEIKQGSKRKIPQERLEEVLTIIDDEDHPIWEDHNISCSPSIYTYWQQRAHAVSEQNLKIKYARQFLLRRDWINMYKILSLSNTKLNIYFPLMSKYAALLLAHTDAEQFNKYVQFLTSMVDSSAVLKKCTGIAKDHGEE